MTEPNPYAPPVARVADIDSTDELPFFPVSITKFVVLSLCTFTLYTVYWFYKQWKHIKAREASNIMPFLRAVFAIFFCYSCFVRIRDHEAPALAPTLQAGLLAAVWILLNVMAYLPDPFWTISLVAFLPLIPVVKRANAINLAADPTSDPNSRFTTLNWLGVVLGILFLALVVFSLMVPMEAEVVVAL